MSKDDGICDYCNSNMNGDECSNPNCGTNIFRSRENEKRIEELEKKLETTQLRLKTCSANCTTHELNEAKALEQLEAVRDHLNKRSFRTYSGTHKAVYVDDIERILEAAMEEDK